MDNDTINMVNRLSFENLLWVAFIIASAMDIYGDELTKKGLIYHDQVSQQKAHRTFLRAILVSVVIYIYFFMRNYNDYKKHKTKTYEIRLIGSTFLLLGALCLLYFQLNTTETTESASNV